MPWIDPSHLGARGGWVVTFVQFLVLGFVMTATFGVERLAEPYGLGPYGQYLRRVVAEHLTGDNPSFYATGHKRPNPAPVS
jgi:hypothetical protein